jgi:hypothetical protein
VGLYYTCINSYLTPESPAWGDVVRGTLPSREPSSQKTLRRTELDSNFRFRARFGLVFVVSLFVLRFVAEA